jgi:hypothetical protein
MARHRHSRRRRHSHHVKRGGYSSAATYGVHVNGLPNAQFSRTFDQNGPYSNRVGAEYVGAQRQNLMQPGTPSAHSLKEIQSAGKRSRRRKRGGFLGEVINQAIVPFGLLGMQQSYKRKRHGGKTRRHRRR